MTATIVDRLHTDFEGLVEFLSDQSQPSLQSTADETFRKALLLAAASYFEQEIMRILLDFADRAGSQNELLTGFFRNKAIKRQYHTLFNWESSNANSFFGLFGDGFKSSAKEEVKANDQLDASVKAFLEVGRERNRLVHQNYGSYTLEKTSDEIFGAFENAKCFVAWIEEQLVGSCNSDGNTAE